MRRQVLAGGAALALAACATPSQRPVAVESPVPAAAQASAQQAAQAPASPRY
jgi:hypothetical protein